MSGNVGTQAGGNGASDNAGLPLRDVAGQAKEVGAQASAAAGEVAGQVKAKATDAAGQLKDQAFAAVEQQKSGIADKLEDLAEAAHRSGEQMTGHQDFIAQLIERGATELGNLASTLRNNDLNGLLGNMQDLARRQPALFAGASIAAGFALARFGKVAVAGASKDDLPKVPAVSELIGSGQPADGEPGDGQPVADMSAPAREYVGASHE